MFSKNKKGAVDDDAGIDLEQLSEGSDGLDGEESDRLRAEGSDEESDYPDELAENQPAGRTGDFISISRSKLMLIKKLLRTIRDSQEQAENLLAGIMPGENFEKISQGQANDEHMDVQADLYGQEKVIEGVFDGEKMVGPDGKQYTVPSNYASKSKLVEGDLMKLTITANGTFLYKQIGPIDRARVIGTLSRDEDGNHNVESNGKRWRVLTASVTYFRGESGDEAVILVPKSGDSKWGAIENIIKS